MQQACHLKAQKNISQNLQNGLWSGWYKGGGYVAFYDFREPCMGHEMGIVLFTTCGG